MTQLQMGPNSWGSQNAGNWGNHWHTFPSPLKGSGLFQLGKLSWHIAERKIAVLQEVEFAVCFQPWNPLRIICDDNVLGRDSRETTMVARSAAQNCPNRLILPVCTSMSGMCRRYYNIFYRIYIYVICIHICVCVAFPPPALQGSSAPWPWFTDVWCWNCEINWFRGYVARDQLRTGHLLAYNIPKKNNIDTSI